MITGCFTRYLGCEKSKVIAMATTTMMLTSAALGDLNDVGVWPAAKASDGQTVEIRGRGSTPRTMHPEGESLVQPASQGSNRRSDVLIPLFLSTSDPRRQGFARIVNYSDRAGTVTISAIDDAGAEFGPVFLDLPAGGVRHFNSHDLEFGNVTKLKGSTGSPTAGDWRLHLSTDLQIEALAYVRTTDGFLTSLNETAWNWGSDKANHTIFTFNPASNYNQRSELRLVNPSDHSVEIAIWGWDDNGKLTAMSGTLPGNVARTLTAVELEQGIPGWDGQLGNGEGKWRLQVEASGPIYVMSLLTDPRGYVTNLSAFSRFNAGSCETCTAGGRIRLFKSASHHTQQGFLRIINHSDTDGVVTLKGVDDAGVEVGSVMVNLPADGVRHINSHDLEFGNVNKLEGALGSPSSGDWRLLLESELNVRALSYVRTKEGFLTSLNEAISWEDGWWYVPTFNPGSNWRQQSVLRIDNINDEAIEVSIRGIDDDGQPSRSSVTGTLPANGTVRLTAKELEEGPKGWSGKLGNGKGKWRLLIPNRGFFVMSLMENPQGYVTNLSTARIPSGGVAAVRDRLPPEARPSVGLLRSRVDHYTETTAEFTLDVFAVTAESELHPLEAEDLEIRSFEGTATGSIFDFTQEGIRSHSQASLGAYSATFLFDQSGSITSTDPQDARITAAKVFLGNLSSGDDVSLLAFASGGGLPHDPVTAYRSENGNRFTSDPDGFDGALAILADLEGGGTPLYDSIVSAVNYTEQHASNSNRAVLVFTDGQDTASKGSLEDAISASKTRGIPLHTIALSTGVDLAVLSQLSGDTGGSLTRATNAGALISYYGALGPFLSGSSQFYRTKWRVTVSGGQMRFGPGAWFQTGVIVALPDGLHWVPFRIDI